MQASRARLQFALRFHRYITVPPSSTHTPGTYAPSLRLIYSLPGPPSPAVVAAARGCLQLAALLAALLVSLCRASHLTDGAAAAAAACTAAPKPERSPSGGAAFHAQTAAAAVAQQPAGPEAAACPDLRAPLLPKALPAADSMTASTSRAATASTATAPSERVLHDRDAEQAAEVLVEEGRRSLRQQSLLLGLPPAVLAAFELG